MQDRWKKWLQYAGFILVGIVVGLAFRYQSNESLINTDQLNAVLISNIARSTNDLQVATKTIEDLNAAMQNQNKGIAETKALLTQLIGDKKLDETVVEALNNKGWQLTAPPKTEK